MSAQPDVLPSCAFCQQVWPKGDRAHARAVLTEHMLKCEQHPIFAMVKRLDSALAQIQRLKKAAANRKQRRKPDVV